MTILDQLLPSTAIFAWRNQRLSQFELMRSLVSYCSWDVPVVHDGPLASGTGLAVRLQSNIDEKDRPYLTIFEDADSLSSYCATVSKPPERTLSIQGTWLFQQSFDALDFVVINPGSDVALTLDREMLAHLKAMAAAVEVERALVELRTQAQPNVELLRIVRLFPVFLLAFKQVDDGFSLYHAPDEKGRKLAAIFTHEDCARACLSWNQAQGRTDELITNVMCGELLFQQLMQLKLDGMTFNCSGPAPALAFAQPFASVVLQS